MRTYAARVVAVFALLLVALVTAPAPALASCAAREPAEVVGDSDVKLAGLLVAVDDPGGNVSPHDVAWTIEVATVHRGEAPATVGAGLPGAADVDLPQSGMSLTTMLAVGLLGLLVVVVGGLALAVGLGLVANRRRSPRDAGGQGAQSDSSDLPPL